MNRLWLRLSLAFTAVVLIAIFGISSAIRLNNAALTDPNNPPPPEVVEYFEQFRRNRLLPDLTSTVIIIGAVAIGAGVWMSRSLTAPLSELEEAAQAIAHNDLSHRVRVHGSQEMIAVGTAFNEMAAQLEQEETLRQNLLSDVAHELRHPLHILQGNLQAILDDVYPLNKEEIARLYDQTHHLSVLVEDLRLLAQAEARQLILHKQMTDIATLVKETVISFQPMAADKNITLKTELLGTMPEWPVDRVRFRQALYNLLDNALYHTPESGMVTVQVEQMPDSLQVRVSDTGEGLPPEQLPHVFDRFYRTDAARSREKGSAGLGLAIVKAIVEAHGGMVTAVSPGQDQGSTFTISFPVLD
ncbi:MAG TPA: HAMP domain-containing protein [Anaerolineae bacterium]|nr:HAMP domain-containing protein [Anaerolineae bacterium]